MEEKYTKVIAVGEEAINYLEDIKHNLQKNASFENIKVTKDVDKEFVRGLLDGIEVLYMLYDSSDKDVVNILKAISFMAQERRVLCIGLDICLKENKEDIGVDKEFKLNKYNLETTMDMINLISEAMDEETLIYVDLSDLKEIFQSKGAVSYSVKEFELDKNHAELAKMLEEDFYKSEGELTKIRSLIVCENSLHEIGKSLNLGYLLRMSKGEELTGGRERVSLIADAVEALIAAIYLDKGLEFTKDYIIGRFEDIIKKAINNDIILDYKTRLQEYLQKNGEVSIVYELIKFEGPPHRRKFYTKLIIDSKELTYGEGYSKKESEQNAAKAALEILEGENE